MFTCMFGSCIYKMYMYMHTHVIMEATLKPPLSDVFFFFFAGDLLLYFAPKYSNAIKDNCRG